MQYCQFQPQNHNTPIQGPAMNFGVQHGYFAVTGFDLSGGDIQVYEGYASFEEAIIDVKKRINFNDNLCGTISKQTNKTFTIYIKVKTQTNPSKNSTDQWRCTNIFYGRRFLAKAESQGNNKHSHNFDYYMVGGLNMWGGDIDFKHQIKSFDQAYQVLIDMLNLDGTKSGNIAYKGKDSYSIYLKDTSKTNPTHEKNDRNNQWSNTSVFFGRTI